MAMTPPDALFRAAMNRLIARVGEGVADAAAGVAVAVQDAPDRIRQEWDLFQEEVKAEAERLQQTSDSGSASEQSSDPESHEPLQQRIDRLRAQVAELSMRLEERP